MSYGDQDFSEDLFEHTKMSFWDHIEELRMHMWKAIVGFFVGMVLGLFVGDWMVKVIAHPVEVELAKFHAEHRKRVMEDLAKNQELKDMNEPREFTLILRGEQLQA